MESEAAIESRELIEQAKPILGTQEALTLIQKALRLHPQNFEAQLLYAAHTPDHQVKQTMLRHTTESFGEYLSESADASFEEVQMYYAALLQLAETEFACQDFDAGMDIYTSLLAMDPSDLSALRYRVLSSLFQRKEFERSLTFWKSLNFPEVTWDLAGVLSLHGTGELDEARTQLQNLLNRDKSFLDSIDTLNRSEEENQEIDPIQAIAMILLKSYPEGMIWFQSESPQLSR